MSMHARQGRLPGLRPELQLLEGAPGVTGEPTWLLHDPLLNRFVQIDFATHETLRLWRSCGTVEELIARADGCGRVHLDPDGVAHLAAFLEANSLTAEVPAEGWRRFADAGNGRSPLTWLLHNYLFMRLPLCRPQAFLERTLPVARALASRPMRAIVAGMGLLGLYLVSREWEQFAATFQNLFTWDGALFMLLGLGLVKAAHELGHAYTAVALGCRVHSMGVAFVVMAPMLYTDVTDAWRLRDRRQRILIDSAGIQVEIAIAAVALFCWAFLPEGALRSLAFTLSAVSVASSLAINLNPFMRFDGYYLLSEAIGVENLQSRAFELGRWRLREWLFAPGAAPPERLPRRLETGLVLYAWVTWIYRLVLFVGIAVLVYQYFFKLLGIILFGVEMVYFVGRPVMSEVAYWWRNRERMLATRRSLVSASVAGLVVALCLVPWSTRVEIPSIVESARLQPLHPVRAARIVAVEVRHGASVKAGELLARLESPDVGQEIELARSRLALARFQHGRRGADAGDLASTGVLESTIESLLTRLEGLERQREELDIRAPFDGRIVDLDAGMHPGRWVSPRDLIALVAADDAIVAKGYVAESDLARIAAGGSGRFIPEGPLRESFPVRIEQVARSGAAQIDIPDLTSAHSGRIAVNVDEKRRLVPTSAQYLVHMSADASPHANDLSVRGLVLADGRPESLVARVWRQALKVLVREAGA